MELLKAPWSGADLDAQIWTRLARTKMEKGITIPLPALAVTWLKEAKSLGVVAIMFFPLSARSYATHGSQYPERSYYSTPSAG